MNPQDEAVPVIKDHPCDVAGGDARGGVLRHSLERRITEPIRHADWQSLQLALLCRKWPT